MQAPCNGCNDLEDTMIRDVFVPSQLRVLKLVLPPVLPAGSHDHTDISQGQASVAFAITTRLDVTHTKA